MSNLPQNWGKGNSQKTPNKPNSPYNKSNSPYNKADAPYNKTNSPYNKPNPSVPPKEAEELTQKPQTETAEGFKQPSQKPKSPAFNKPQGFLKDAKAAAPFKKAEKPKAVDAPKPQAEAGEQKQEAVEVQQPQQTQKAVKSPQPQQKAKSKRPLIILSLVLVIAVITAGLFFVLKDNDPPVGDFSQESQYGSEGEQTSSLPEAPVESEAESIDISKDSSEAEDSDEDISQDISLPEISEPEVSEPVVSVPEISEPEVSEPVVSVPEISEPEISAPIGDTPAELVCPKCSGDTELVGNGAWMSCDSCQMFFASHEKPIYGCNLCGRQELTSYMVNTEGTTCCECILGKTDYERCIYCNRSNSLVYIKSDGGCTACLSSYYAGIPHCKKCSNLLTYESTQAFDGNTCPSCARCDECYGDITAEEYTAAGKFLCKSCYDKSMGVYYSECELCNAPLDLNNANDYNGKRCRQCANCIYCGDYVWQWAYEEAGDFICHLCINEANAPTEEPNIQCPECGHSWYTEQDLSQDPHECPNCAYYWYPWE